MTEIDPDALEELRAAGYMPTNLDEAVRDAQLLLACSESIARQFVMGHEDLQPTRPGA